MFGTTLVLIGTIRHDVSIAFRCLFLAHYVSYYAVIT